jgi:hypothetical protein
MWVSHIILETKILPGAVKTIWSIVRFFCVPEWLYFEINRLFTNFDQTTYSKTKGYCPALVIIGFPKDISLTGQVR